MALTKVRGSGLGTVNTADLDGAVTINDSSADKDFRVESNGNANMLVIDGGNDIASIGRAVNSSSTLAIQNKDDTNNNAIDVFNDNGNRTFSIQSNTSGDAQFKAFKNDGTQTFTLDGSGNALVGTTSTTPNPGIALQPNGNIGIGNSSGNSGVSFLEFRRSASQIGGVTQSGTTGVAFNTSSDYRLKENVNYDFDATSRLKQLKPSRFNFKTDKDITVDGFLAHEVSSIVPEAITGKKDAVDADGNPEYQGIDQSKLVPLLTKALQESIARADALEARIKKLEDG